MSQRRAAAPHNPGRAGRPTLLTMIASPQPLGAAAGLACPPAAFFTTAAKMNLLLRDWLAPHRDLLFRWAMGRAVDSDSRRGFAETAVAIQRLRGRAEFVVWLYGAAVQAALGQVACGGLPEATLAGLPPELRTVLRLVSRAELRPEEATALLAQRMAYVRGRLLQTRLRA